MKSRNRENVNRPGLDEGPSQSRRKILSLSQENRAIKRRHFRIVLETKTDAPRQFSSHRILLFPIVDASLDAPHPRAVSIAAFFHDFRMKKKRNPDKNQNRIMPSTKSQTEAEEHDEHRHYRCGGPKFGHPRK